ncbi:MAG: ROK family protein [Pirellula sp.]|jgi:glucokinase|nr:ROK family protein [Pirellula sp.]
MAATYFCGFDLGGTKMLCVLLDEKLKVIGRKKKKSKGMEGPHAGVIRIVDLIRETIADANLPLEGLASIGIGCPGPVDMERGIVHLAVNLKWKNVPLGNLLFDAFQRPVSVLNDVDAGVFGEYSVGAAVGAHSVAGIFPGTGIGGGFVYDGKILRGRRHTGMEIGHTRIATTDHSSGARMTGTLESEASRLAIAASCAKLAIRGEAPTLLKSSGTDLAEIRSKALAAAVKGGDEAVEQVIRKAARTVGYSCVNLIHLLTPEVIVLGGGLVEALSDIYLEEVEKTVANNVLECYADTFEIKLAKLGDDAGAIGAAIWAAQQVRKDLKFPTGDADLNAMGVLAAEES